MSRSDESMTIPPEDSHVAWVKAENLGYDIGQARLLTDISFEAYAGELIALVGPNGAGKSTLLSMLTGDLSPSSGSVEIFGKAPVQWKADEAARLRAIMTQHNDQPFSYTVREIVEMGRAPHPASDSDDQIVDEAMKATDIAHLADRDITTLSGGENARAIFSRILTQSAKLILLDEPTAPLDLKYQEVVLKEAFKLTRQGACVIVVLHDLSLASRYCDRIAMFSESKLVAMDSPQKVFTVERIREVYDQSVEIIPHPQNGRPIVIPV